MSKRRKKKPSCDFCETPTPADYTFALALHIYMCCEAHRRFIQNTIVSAA